MHYKYLDESITANGQMLYKIESTLPAKDGGVDIGLDVWAAKSASIGNGARIGEWASIGEEARCLHQYDYLLIGPIGSRNAYTTIWRHADGQYRVSCGRFCGTIAAFEDRVRVLDRR